MNPADTICLGISDLFATFATVCDPFPTMFPTKVENVDGKSVVNCHKYLFLDIAREYCQVASSCSSLLLLRLLRVMTGKGTRKTNRKAKDDRYYQK
jgi:hypothetical protein